MSFRIWKINIVEPNAVFVYSRVQPTGRRAPAQTGRALFLRVNRPSRTRTTVSVGSPSASVRVVHLYHCFLIICRVKALRSDSAVPPRRRLYNLPAVIIQPMDSLQAMPRVQATSCCRRNYHIVYRSKQFRQAARLCIHTLTHTR
jgi:hypothetical protein